ncbi:MAG: RNA polymerase sigma factor [Clostridia bacterium]|nr:RNA polymerase sigma factor [Clostridia bacterium]
MNAEKLTDYVERVYGYAVRHTLTRDEADELSQEILFTAVRELPRLRDESRFEPWLWGLAANVTRAFRRQMGRQRAMYAWDVPEELLYDEGEDEDSEELYALLRRSVAMLSAAYRDIIILYYFDGLSVKEISARLGLAEGTITWRLSEARSKLKKEYTNMEATALRPIRMNIGCYGSGNYEHGAPTPNSYINDALSQNILWHCYEKPLTIEEIAKLCGVPAYYIEDRMDNLVRREAVIEPSKGRYQTDFIIWTDKYAIYCEENAEASLSALLESLTDALHAIVADLREVDFYRAEKSEEDLIYLYGVMAFALMSRKYSRLPYPDIPRSYDGNNWRYTANMVSGQHQRANVGCQHCANNGSRGTYEHFVYSFDSFPYKDMMPDNYINVCEDILTAGTTDDADSAALAIRDGFITRREDGSLFVGTPAFNREQKARFDVIADHHLAPLMPDYAVAVNRFLAGYAKLFPKHLQDDAARMCQNMFFGLFSTVAAWGQKNGRLPAHSGSVCDVLTQR